MTPITAPWPFAQWGIDLIGPLLIERKQYKFPIVIIDYSLKWVEVEPDNGKQFDNPKFQNFCQDLEIKNHYSSPRHPQVNGQIEVTNKSLLKIIKTQLKGGKECMPKRAA